MSCVCWHCLLWGEDFLPVDEAEDDDEGGGGSVLLLDSALLFVLAEDVLVLLVFAGADVSVEDNGVVEVVTVAFVPAAPAPGEVSVIGMCISTLSVVE